MEKDHVVISLEKYEAMKKEKDEAVAARDAAEARANHATKILADVIVAASNVSFSVSATDRGEHNAHIIVTQAGYTVEISHPGGKITCGRGNTQVSLSLSRAK